MQEITLFSLCTIRNVPGQSTPQPTATQAAAPGAAASSGSPAVL